MPAVAEHGGHSVERIDTLSDGRFRILSQQDCEAVITLMRETDTRRLRPSTQDATKLIGSVPNLLAVAWAQEWGVKLLSREWIERAQKRLKHDPNWRSLRVGH